MQKITYADYVRPMIPFLRHLPEALRAYGPDPSLKYYGTGDTGHWAVQCNQQVLSALAVLSDTPGLEAFGSPYSAGELRDLALSMFRYSLRTHLTGDLDAVDGRKWGRHWISVLGLERGVSGINILRPYLTDDEKARLRALDLFEADYRLNDYPVEAGIDASKGKNKPESNIWNAGFLFRAAANYPDCPNAAAYVEKGTRMMLAGLSHPSDATSGEIIRGKPVGDWFSGANFTENWSLDHHHYMNVGYMFICLSNIACLYFNFKERGQKIPESLLFHVRDLWNVAKKFVFPDGRLLRIGGDSRSRYTYCQNFAQQAYTLAAELFGDEDAIRYEKGYLALIEKEQAQNADGSFFGKRLAPLKDESYYFYRRLEADPFFALGCGACWRRKFDIKSEAPDLPAGTCEKPYAWHDDFHVAALRREGNAVRSMMLGANAGLVPTKQFYTNVPAQGGWAPAAICAPLDRSDLAEWTGNLIGFIGLRKIFFDAKPELTLTDGGFRWTASGDIWEYGPTGEGEPVFCAGHRALTVEALPDGKTMLFADKFTVTRECTLVHGFRTVHCLVPNDVYNGYRRTWRGKDFVRETVTTPGKTELVKTGCRVLNVDDALSFFAVKGGDLALYSEPRQNITLYTAMTSLYADEICMDCELDPRRYGPGETVYDVVYAVAPSTTLAEALAVPARGKIVGEGAGRAVEFTGFDGKTHKVVLAE